MKRVFVILLIVSILCLTAVCAAALGTLPAANEQPRHTVCTALSDSAKAYYTGGYQYSSLSALSGAQDISDGYAAMQDNALFSALHALMADTHEYYTSYSGYSKGSLAYFWASTDAVSASDTYIMFYSDVMSGTQGISLNREHVWPKSRASFGAKTRSGGADLHHLRPAVSTLNNAKSDHLFGNINGVYTTGVTEGKVNGEVCYWVNTSKDLFECKDDVKGDVARILLYVYCRWEQPNLYTDIPADHLPANDSDSTDSGKKVVESLDTLLGWCAEDPVDTWEMRRNDLVESVQGNRNVFIDYPELAWQLFGKQTPQGMITPSSGGQERLLGDADCDGAVSVIDATVIQRQLALIAVQVWDETAADADGDKDVTILDATLIRRFEAAIPQPYPIGEPVQS